MKRSTFYLAQGLGLGALCFAVPHSYTLALACFANFSLGRWAEITK